jgi:hypothetical protein
VTSIHIIPTPELSRVPSPGSGPGTSAPEYAALHNGLVSWWILANGVTGARTLADSGPANRTGLNSNGSVTFSTDDARAQELYTPGTPGAAQFTSSAAVSIGDGTPRRYLPSSDFTFTCFVKFTSMASGTVITYSSGLNVRYQLKLLVGALRFTMELTGGGSAMATSQEIIDVDTWYFVACDYDSDEQNLGIRVAPIRTGIYEPLLVARAVAEATGGIALNSGNLYFGGWLPGVGFVGRLLAVGFWSRILNQVELGILNAPWDFPWPNPIANLFVSSPGPDTTLDLETEGDFHDEYEIWRQRERGGAIIDAWFPIALDADGVYRHEDAGIAGDVLSYRARGRNNLSWGPYGPTARWTIGYTEVEHLYEDPYAGPYADAGPAPTNLQAIGTAPVVLTWDDGTDGLYGHEVWRDDGNGFFQIAEVAPGLETYNDSAGTAGSGYKVRAYGNGNPSAFSNEIAAVDQVDLLTTLASWWQLTDGISALSDLDQGPYAKNLDHAGASPSYIHDTLRGGTPGAANFGAAVFFGLNDPAGLYISADAPFTIGVWVWLDALADGTIIYYGDLNLGYELSYEAGTNQFWWVVQGMSGVAGVLADAPGAISTANWYWIEASYDPATQLAGLRVATGRTAEGEPLELASPYAASAPVPGGLDETPGNLVIGYGSAVLQGRVTAVGFWVGLLTDLERGRINAPFDYPFTTEAARLTEEGTARLTEDGQVRTLE